MFYHVYKLQMSKEATNALNASGSWTAHPEAKVYAALRNGLRNGDAMPEAIRAMCDNVMSAALMGIYHHGLTVEADDLEQVFAYDNGGPRSSNVDPIYHCTGLPSLSVGDDVVVDQCQDGILRHLRSTGGAPPQPNGLDQPAKRGGAGFLGCDLWRLRDIAMDPQLRASQPALEDVA
jgi:hypothetical protein